MTAPALNTARPLTTAYPSRTALIGECVEPIQTWNPARDSEEETLRYIDISSISQGEKKILGVSEIATSEAPSRARQLVRTGDVLVSTVRPNLNAVAFVPDEMDGATASTGFCILRPNQNQLTGRYLFHWVQSPSFVADLVNQATGQSYPAVSDKIIKQSRIPLPSLDEQKRIAAILDQANELRCFRQRAIDRLNELGQAIFYEMFGDPAKNSRNLPTRPLGSLIKVSSGESLTAENQRGGSYPVYGGNGINGWHDEFRVPAGTIIIGRVGVYCGAIHVTEMPAWVTDNALIVTTRDESTNTTYLSAALRYANLNQYAGRSAQPLVSGSRIYPVKILVPDIDSQRHFEVRIADLNLLSKTSSAHLTTFEGLFSSLQHRAFRGEL